MKTKQHARVALPFSLSLSPDNRDRLFAFLSCHLPKRSTRGKNGIRTFTNVDIHTYLYLCLNIPKYYILYFSLNKRD